MWVALAALDQLREITLWPLIVRTGLLVRALP
jgi:hypothetical protein